MIQCGHQKMEKFKIIKGNIFKFKYRNGKGINNLKTSQMHWWDTPIKGDPTINT